MKPYEIYWGNNVKWGKNSAHQHMWVIVDTYAGKFGCFPISSSCYDQYGFEVPETHPDFPATGLHHTSYILYVSIIELTPNELGKHQGELRNELLAAFKNEAGL